MSLLGIDIGTTGCKAAAFSEDGQCLASAYREYQTQYPQADWAELDSRDVWAKTEEVISEVASQTGGDPITALCTSSMGEAVAPVTDDRRILDNCILFSDMRGGEYVEDLQKVMSQEQFYEINANILGPNYTMPKLLWIKEHNPDLYDQTDHFALWGDMVGFMLGCEHVASHALASRTLLFDIRREDWSGPLLEWSGIDRGKLGRCVQSGTVAGVVADAAALRLGLPKGVSVVVGGHDQCCNSLGAGIYRAGMAVCGIGSYECITPTYDRIPAAAPMLGNGLNVEHHLLPGLYVSFIYNQGGILVKWFRDTFASADRKLLGEDADIYAELAREMPEEPTRLLTLPYFDMTGPPEFVDDAAGAIVGLRTSTTRGEILKSIMESETLYFVQSINALRELGVDTSEFIATGGGAKSDQWLQIKADVFGIPFVRPRITEASLLGAAILAGLATGVFANPAEGVERFVERVRVFEPDPHRRRIYQEKQEQYQQLLPSLHDLLRTL